MRSMLGRVERLKREIGILDNEAETDEDEIVFKYIAAVDGAPANGTIEDSVVETMVIGLHSAQRFPGRRWR
jgi:hypothetical protein